MSMKAHGKTVWFPLELESNARRRTGVVNSSESRRETFHIFGIVQRSRNDRVAAYRLEFFVDKPFRLDVLREDAGTVDVDETFIDGDLDGLSRFDQAMCEGVGYRLANGVDGYLWKFLALKPSVKFDAPIDRVRNILDRFVDKVKHRSCIAFYIEESHSPV